MGVFHVFKLHKWYQIVQSISYITVSDKTENNDDDDVDDGNGDAVDGKSDTNDDYKGDDAKKRGKTSPATILSGANSTLASGRLNFDWVTWSPFTLKKNYRIYIQVQRNLCKSATHSTDCDTKI